MELDKLWAILCPSVVKNTENQKEFKKAILKIEQLFTYLDD